MTESTKRKVFDREFKRDACMIQISGRGRERE